MMTDEDDFSSAAHTEDHSARRGQCTFLKHYCILSTLWSLIPNIFTVGSMSEEIANIVQSVFGQCWPSHIRPDADWKKIICATWLACVIISMKMKWMNAARQRKTSRRLTDWKVGMFLKHWQSSTRMRETVTEIDGMFV